jgi:hypothetical protein
MAHDIFGNIATENTEDTEMEDKSELRAEEDVR